MDEIRFGLLGPLLARDASGARIVAAPKQRTILAALMLRAGQVVPAAELVELIWSGASPVNARKTVQSYVMRLRQTLGERLGPRLVTRDPGYAFDAAPSELDVAELEHAVAAARRSAAYADWPLVAHHSSEALALRRGAPLVDVASDVLHRDHVPRLEELLVTAAELSVEAQMRLGNLVEAADLLAPLCRAHPLRESLRLRQMHVLDRMHRRAEAIDAYHDLRGVLAAEVGIEPGAELHDLYVQLLRGRPERPAPVVRSGLPQAAETFTGRADIILLIQDLLAAGHVVVVQGPLGIGKTAIAVHVARRLAALYPDGQVFVDVRGSTPGPMDPAEVVRQVLTAIGGIRDTPLREAAAGRRLLVVLDDVRDADQIGGLTAPPPGCAVIVTSRKPLAVDGAEPVRLGRLSTADSLTLARRLAGPNRGPRWTAATQLVVEVADGFPAAIVDFAARIGRRDITGALAAIADPGRRLDGALRAQLDLAFATLDERMHDDALLLSAAVDWPVSAGAAAATLGVPEGAARHTLDGLAGSGWLLPDSCGGYDAAGPVRLFLRQLAGRRLALAVRDAAIRRHLAWQVRSAWAMALAINPQRCAAELADVEKVLGVASPGDRDSGAAWFAREEQHLRAAVERAVGARHADAGWKLAAAAWHPAYVAGRHHEALALLLAGLRCAQVSGDPLAMLWINSDLGCILRFVGQPAKAIAHLRTAQALVAEVDRPSAESAILTNLGAALVRLGRTDEAIEAYREALASTRKWAIQDRECLVLTALGNVLRSRGLIADAADHYRAALALDVPNPHYRGETLWGLGEVAMINRSHEAAADWFRGALEAYRDAGSPNDVARTGGRLADVLAILGHHDEAAAQRAETDLLVHAPAALRG